MKKVLGVLSGVALATSGMVLGLVNPASAVQLWNWSYSGSGLLGGSGTFTTDDGPTDYLVTAITGISEGSAITSLYPIGGFQGNDNILNASFPQLTFAGIAFTTSSPESYNFFYDAGGSTGITGYGIVDSSDNFNAIAFSATPVATPPVTTPEPTSLIGLVAVGMGLLVSKRRKSA